MRTLRASCRWLLLTGLIGISLCTAMVATADRVANEAYQRANRMVLTLKVHKYWMTIALRGASESGDDAEMEIADAVTLVAELQQEIDARAAELQAMRLRGEKTDCHETLLLTIRFAKLNWQRKLRGLEIDIASIKKMKAQLQILESQLVELLNTFVQEGGGAVDRVSPLTLQRLDELVRNGEIVLGEIQTLLIPTAE